MKKRISALIAFCFLFFSFGLSAFAAKPGVSAKSAVLMCVESGEVLYSKNPDQCLPMASTTKIMTSLIALEACVPEMEITVTKEMVSVEGTSMGLVPGDSVSMKELIYGMLLQSGNDAANTVACVLSGSPDAFAELMNKRASEIGMKNTHFVTASGLDSENHYSTAYDMALLACESMKNPEFAWICSRKNARLTYGNPPYARTLTNHNRLLWSYSDAVGIKTGFTKKSGRCLVSAAERDGITLVAVTLNAPDDWNDHISMFEYGFSKCRGIPVKCDLSSASVSVVGGKNSSVSVRLLYEPYWIEGEVCYCRVMLRPFEYAPIFEGDILGTAVFETADNKVIDSVPVVSAESVSIKETVSGESETNNMQKSGFFSRIISKIKDFFRGEPIGGK